MTEINPYLARTAARIAERAELFHQASLRHLEASRQAYSQGLRGEHDAQLSVAYAREALRHDTELRRLIKQFPDLAVVPSEYLALIPTTATTATTPQLTQSEIDLTELNRLLQSVEC